MGYGSYSHEAHQKITTSQARAPAREVFKETEVSKTMLAYRMKVRESRDSAEHPRSIAIAFGLDLTGSMEHIPINMAQKSLPNFMQVLVTLGVQDPQPLFAGIGDVATDGRNAFQVGQFESTAELMNRTLTGMAVVDFCNGGGNGGESYHLFAEMLASRTSIDCFERRGQKGVAFITGDDNLFPSCRPRDMSVVFGDISDTTETVKTIFERASQTWDIFCIIPDASRARECEHSWREVLGERVIVAQRYDDICDIAGALTAIQTGAVTSLGELQQGLLRLGRSGDVATRIILPIEAYAHSILRGAPERPAQPVTPSSGTPHERRKRREASR